MPQTLLTSTLYLPELREMLAEGNEAEMRDFCKSWHPARTADFLGGLTAQETWQFIQNSDAPTRVEIFGYFNQDRQVLMIETLDLVEMSQLVAELPPDDRVDLLNEVQPKVVEKILPLLPAEERRDILRLRAYPEDTAGAVMTSEVARLSEDLSVVDALGELGRQAEQLETIYYIYIVDDEDHLRGVVSARQLVSAMGKPETKIGDLMERDLVTVSMNEDQEEVARKVAHYDLLAIPVVDEENHMLGIITYDDIFDVVREEATEDAHRIAAVDPLEEGYLKTPWFTLTWKRAIWLVILFFGALLTALVLRGYEHDMVRITWLVLFIPLVISSGGNCGNQSAALIITALTTGDIAVHDWRRIVLRELVMGVLLGSFLAVIGYFAAWLLIDDPFMALVIPLTLILVVLCGTLIGAILPLTFRRLGLDPALMSSPFVAGIIDIVGIVIYMNVALLLLPK